MKCAFSAIQMRFIVLKRKFMVHDEIEQDAKNDENAHDQKNGNQEKEDGEKILAAKLTCASRVSPTNQIMRHKEMQKVVKRRQRNFYTLRNLYTTFVYTHTHPNDAQARASRIRDAQTREE